MTSELINIVKRKYCGCMGDYVVIVPINHPWVNGKKAGISKSINCVIVNDIPGASKWIEQPDVWKFGTPLISHPLLSK